MLDRGNTIVIRLLLIIMIFAAVSGLSKVELLMTINNHLIYGLMSGALTVFVLGMCSFGAILLLYRYYQRTYWSSIFGALLIIILTGLVVGGWQGYSNQLEAMPMVAQIMLLGVIYALFSIIKEIMAYLIKWQTAAEKLNQPAEPKNEETEVEKLYKQRKDLVDNGMRKYFDGLKN